MATGSLRGGIDLGGTKIQTAVVGEDGSVLGEARHPTPESGGPKDVAAEMAAALRAAAKDAGAETNSLQGVGVGSPGDADESTGTVSGARNLPGWEGSFPLGESLSDALGTQVRVGNDVQVATEAEFHLGSGKPYQTILGVFWGTGVGGGLILDGKPWLGRGAAGEIGHVVVKRGGARCPCGRKGCMEAYAGRIAMEAKAREEMDSGTHTDLFKIAEHHDKDRLTSGVWERALDHGDKLTEHLIDRAVEALGTGIASAVNLLDPEAVIFGGGMGLRFGERYRKPLLEEMGKHLFVDDRPGFQAGRARRSGRRDRGLTAGREARRHSGLSDPRFLDASPGGDPRPDQQHEADHDAEDSQGVVDEDREDDPDDDQQQW